MVVYILICPYTKVEESFNTQGIFDLLHTSKHFNFDHLEFTGVVPRTFIGPSILSVLAFPFIKVFKISSREQELIIVRSILGLLLILANSFFRRGIAQMFSSSVSGLYAVLFFVQFHFIFYISRPLPNIFALFLVLLAYGFLVRKNYFKVFLLLGAAMTLFRCEILVLICTLGGSIFLFVGNSKKKTFFEKVLKKFFVCLKMGISLLVSVVGCVCIAVVYDSYFWGRPVWAEAEVFYYNTYLNKSVNWGRSPFYWYFVNALPKALLVSFIFLPFGILATLISCLGGPRGRKIASYAKFAKIAIVAALGFIFLYSFLPHKELRFIFYAIPLLNLVSSFGIDEFTKKIKNQCGPNKVPIKVKVGSNDISSRDVKEGTFCYRNLKNCAVLMILIISFLCTFIFLIASGKNYFGATSLNKLHGIIHEKYKNSSKKISVHLGVHATMNGVSKFLYKDEKFMNVNNYTIEYSKEEVNPLWNEYDYIITGEPKQHENDFDVIGIQSGFNGIKKMKFLVSPKVYVMQKKKKVQRPLTTAEKKQLLAEKKKKDKLLEKEQQRLKKISERKQNDLIEDKILNYTESDLKILRVPIMRWFQRWPKCIINMIVYDTKNAHYRFTKNSFIIVSELFKGYLQFYDEINIKKSKVKLRNDKIVVTVWKKNEKQNWPRLIKESDSPDYLRIDWDEWDDEFNIEFEDAEDNLEEDPEAHGYKFDFAESFVKKYKEKVKPEERDGVNVEFDKEKLEEDYSPYIKFLSEEKGRVKKRRERRQKKLEKAERKRQKKLEKIEKKKNLEEKKNEVTKESEVKEERKMSDWGVHESKEFSELVLNYFGVEKSKAEGLVTDLIENISPFNFAMIITGHLTVLLLFFFVDFNCLSKRKKEKEE